MKITKKLEKEILAVMDDFWCSYLNGDMETWMSYLPDDYRNIGTNAEEYWVSKKEIVNYTINTFKEAVGKAELRNKKTQVFSIEPYIMVHELGDLYIKVEDSWTYYAHTRLSSLLGKTKEGWKILHQHGSYPDSKTEKGEAFAFDEIKAENKKLKDVIQNRTIELKHKNRDLEIEAALERVRARSLGMHNSNELEGVIKVLFQQFKELGMHVQHTGFILDYNNRDDMFIWLADENEITPNITIPYFDSPHWNSFLEAKKEKRTLFTNHLDFEIKNVFYRKLFTYAPEITAEEKNFYLNCDGLAISTVLLDNVGLYIENFSGIPYSVEENKILLRFGQVFQQSYTRFLDLQKAESQAREAQIETALERVRARTMAMQKSNELPEAANLLFDQIKKLGMPAWSAGYCIWKENKDSVELWMSSEGVIQPPFTAPTTEDPLFMAMRDNFQSEDQFHVVDLGGEELVKHYSYMRSLPVVGEILDSIIAAGHPLPEYQIMHYAYFSYGLLLFITYEPVPESHPVFKRFARVFDQTYTRFLDLQNAETRVREAQIETAVEKVRAKALAMHNSSQIMEVVSTLKNEMMGLEIPGVAAATIYLRDENGFIRMWDLSSIQESEEGFQVTLDVKFKLEDTHPDLYIRRVWKNQDIYFIEKQDESDIGITLKWLRQYHPDQADDTENFLKNHPLEYLYHPTVQLESGKMSVDIFNEEPPAEMESILKKMGAAFDLAYKRFKDLQKKEASFRESQIELSLERIRNQVTAMQESTDLFDIVVGMRNEFISLGHEADYFWHMRWSSENYEMSMTSEDGSRLGMVITVPKFVHEQDEGLHQWEKSDHPYYVMDLDAEGAWNYIDKMNTYGHYKQVDPNAPTQEDIEAIGGLTFVIARTTHGEIGFSLAGKIPDPPQESIDTLVRFAGVFDLAYRRFEDLKEAERQTREAEIELSLERVRARSMAMQTSEELAEVTQEFFKQLTSLGMEVFRSWIDIIREDEGHIQTWTTDFDGNFQSKPTIFPLGNNDEVAQFLEDFKSPSKFIELEAHGEEVKEWVNVLYETSSNPIFLISSYPPDLYQVWAKHTYGTVATTKKEPFSDDERNILSRFARVFEQTYRRFLDLQKAEAQAKESRIEAALERVRSRSMAMHHTSELQSVIHTVHEELLKLNISVNGGSFIVINDDVDAELYCWGAGGTANTTELIHVPHFGKPFCTSLIKNIKKGPGFFTEEFTQAEKQDYFTELFNHHPWSALSGKRKEETLTSSGGYTRSCCVLKHTSIFIINHTGRKFSEEENVILKRFSKVFEQSYTRFLDIRKAEAQAREAQIEAALEKVRSRTMAMHNPDELEEVVAIIAEKLQDLGIILDANGVILCTYFKGSRDVMHWIAAPDFSGSGRYLLPYFDHPIFSSAWESKQSGEAYFSRSFSKEEKDSFFEYAFEYSDYKHFPKEFKEWVFQNDKHSLSFAWQKNSAILIPSHTGVVPSESEQEILKRFASVFEQAYVRFRDLKVKEEQATKIEVEKQRLEKTLEHLQATQVQLIQSEKMASLGELTAGIAHEIQNPLNFVNNFSELSSELIDEMLEEIKNGDLEEVIALSRDLRQNLEKINHHGRRADSIVKGMLLHSRSSKGEKVLTDINALCDEFLRLSYHGLRAKDRSFNAEFDMNLDPDLPKVEVVPQDIGRVFLNLFNNAFQACADRSVSIGTIQEIPTFQNKASIPGQNPLTGLEEKTDGKESLGTPEESKMRGAALSGVVKTQTRNLGDKIEITISDNGPGIPDDIKDKIFQPFFTTRPTGQGTGLGLSLAYDIVKAHGGTISVLSLPGKETSFHIELPINH